MQHGPDRPMMRKKPPNASTLACLLAPTLDSRTCPSCESLERRYAEATSHIREVLANRLKTLGEKVRELHRLQDKRDDAIEAFYSHKRRHCGHVRKVA
jgi:hypothetical protein